MSKPTFTPEQIKEYRRKYPHTFETYSQDFTDEELTEILSTFESAPKDELYADFMEFLLLHAALKSLLEEDVSKIRVVRKKPAQA